MTTRPILILGAGELGTAIISSLTSHLLYSSTSYPITLLVRPQTLANPSPSKSQELQHFRSLNVSFIGGDTDNDDLSALTDLFKPFYTVIHASGMLSPTGVQTKITQAALDAGVKLYLPWQFGVDYDVIGPEGGMGLFAEQYAIRQQLRSQPATSWLIISCGYFTSFLFEDVWGVVKKLEDGRIKVTALNSWDDMITSTSAEDIGRATADLVLDEKAPRNQAVYIAGDTSTYREFADVIARKTGKEVVREVWPLKYLQDEAKKDPENKLKKYHVVFAEGKGLSWPKDKTFTAEKGFDMESIGNWLDRNWV